MKKVCIPGNYIYLPIDLFYSQMSFPNFLLLSDSGHLCLDRNRAIDESVFFNSHTSFVSSKPLILNGDVCNSRSWYLKKFAAFTNFLRLFHIFNLYIKIIGLGSFTRIIPPKNIMWFIQSSLSVACLNSNKGLRSYFKLFKGLYPTELWHKRRRVLDFEWEGNLLQVIHWDFVLKTLASLHFLFYSRCLFTNIPLNFLLLLDFSRKGNDIAVRGDQMLPTVFIVEYIYYYIHKPLILKNSASKYRWASEYGVYNSTVFASLEKS